MTEATGATGQEIHAMRKLRTAQMKLEEANHRSYCCEAAQKAEVSRWRKEVRRWDKWLADHATLQAGQLHANST